MKINRKVTKNTIWIIVQNIVCSICSFMLVFICARRLGKDNWGIYNYSLSILSIASTACLFGMSSILVNFFSQNKEDHLIMGTALGIRRVLAFIGVPVTFLILFFSLNNEGKGTIAFAVSVSLLFQGYLIYNEWFIANSCSKYYSIMVICANVVSAIWKVFFFLATDSLQLFCVGILVENIVMKLLADFFLKHRFKKVFMFSKKICMEILNTCKYYAISDLAIIIYTEIDKIIIKHILSDGEVGVYSAAVSLANIWLFVPMALYYSTRPIILSKWDTDREAALNELKRLTYQLLAICIGFILFFLFFKKWIVLFLYGEQYIYCVNALLILCFATLFSVLGTVGTIWILGEKIGKYSAYRTIIGLILNIFLDIIFVSRWGINGAAIATLISYFFTGGCSMAIWKKTRKFYKCFIK